MDYEKTLFLFRLFRKSKLIPNKRVEKNAHGRGDTILDSHKIRNRQPKSKIVEIFDGEMTEDDFLEDMDDFLID